MDEAIQRLQADAKAQVDVRAAVGDLSKPEGIHSVVQATGELDILINNAGVFEQVDFFDIEDEGWDAMWQTNVMSGVRLSRVYLKGMLARKTFGRVIFISSECGDMIPSDMIHYGVSKTAQRAVARGLAELTRGTGVTVNTIMPGPTLTEGVRAFGEKMAANQGISVTEVEQTFFQSYRPTSLLQRFIDPKEVANTVAFFASPLASATNGASIRVEGGTINTI